MKAQESGEQAHESGASGDQSENFFSRFEFVHRTSTLNTREGKKKLRMAEEERAKERGRGMVE